MNSDIKLVAFGLVLPVFPRLMNKAGLDLEGEEASACGLGAVNGSGPDGRGISRTRMWWLDGCRPEDNGGREGETASQIHKDDMRDGQ